MHDTRSHPLLQQVPLTVSPFVQLPTATTLPYTYKAMPSTLPPSASCVTSATPANQPPREGAAATPPSPTAAADPASRSGTSYTPPPKPPKPRYVVSAASGHAAHPDEIIASCQTLQAHAARLQADADALLRRMDDAIRARDLAEKRRVAPGWLDSDERMLEPERKPGGQTTAQEDPAAREARWNTLAGYGTDGLAAAAAGAAGGGPGGPGLESVGSTGGLQPWYSTGEASEMAVPDEGEELDRAFGAMAVGKQEKQ